MADVPVATIDATGLHLPSYDDGLAYFQASFRALYGDDVVLEPSTQDGQFMALLATALKQVNDGIARSYNAYSPDTAQGVGLASVVKINGLRRKDPSYSTVDLVILGQAGSSLTNGVVMDDAGVRWNLPQLVIVPYGGQILVSATAAVPGAIAAPANTITTFATVQRGFQSVTNPAAATLGQPVERDPALKDRQALSTALPSVTILEGLLGAILAVPGVARVRAYENDQNIIDDNGEPAHTMALIIDGGDASTLGAIIASKKAVGVGTYGDVLTTLADAYGISHPIRFFRPNLIPVAWYLKVRALRGYTTDVEAAIRTALADYTTALGIGEDLSLRRAYVPANLTGDPRARAFELVDMTAQRKDTTSDAYGDLTCAFDSAFTCVAADVRIVVVP